MDDGWTGSELMNLFVLEVGGKESKLGMNEVVDAGRWRWEKEENNSGVGRVYGSQGKGRNSRRRVR